MIPYGQFILNNEQRSLPSFFDSLHGDFLIGGSGYTGKKSKNGPEHLLRSDIMRRLHAITSILR